MKNIYVIAEAGVNFNGNKDMAFQLVDAAVAAGADAVKFQTFKAYNLVTKSAGKADYQKLTTEVNESQYDMLKQLELSHEVHYELLSYCNSKNIDFLSTAFDSESLSFLAYKLKLTTLKISSGDITNGPLLLEHARTGCDLILSTGMSTLGEIEEALSVLAFGFISSIDSQLSKEVFEEAYASEMGQQHLQKKVTLLHCTTEYPAPLQEINLNAMLTMSNAFGLKTGYSDHSVGITVPIAAATKGAVIIEKHFTLDKMLPGPDHKASLDPNELKEMVSSIRIVEKIMGNGIKIPSKSEIKNKNIARKSIVAKKYIRKGEVFTKENLTIKRPGKGKTPMEYWKMLGKMGYENYQVDEILD